MITLLLHLIYKDVADYVHNCPQCKVARGQYTGPDTQPGSIIVLNPSDVLCIDFIPRGKNWRTVKKMS